MSVPKKLTLPVPNRSKAGAILSEKVDVILRVTLLMIEPLLGFALELIGSTNQELIEIDNGTR